MQPGWPPGAPAAYPPGAFAAQQGAPGPQGVQPGGRSRLADCRAMTTPAGAPVRRRLPTRRHALPPPWATALPLAGSPARLMASSALLPHHHPIAGQPYGAAPKSANGPPTPRPPGGVAPLAGQMQQMKLGGAPMPAPQPGMPPMGVRPAGLPVAAPGHGMPRPAGPPGTNGFAARPAAPSAFQQQQQRPAGVPGTMPGGVPPPAAAAPPPGAVRPPAAAPVPGMRLPVPGMTAGPQQPGMPGPGGLAPRPLGGMPLQQQPGGLRPPMPGMQQPSMQQPGTQQPLASTASGGFSTPRKSQQQQQQQEPYGTPPPFALQVASPSPTKRAGMATAVGGMQPAGGQLGQQAMQGEHDLGCCSAWTACGKGGKGACSAEPRAPLVCRGCLPVSRFPSACWPA